MISEILDSVTQLMSEAGSKSNSVSIPTAPELTDLPRAGGLALQTAMDEQLRYPQVLQSLAADRAVRLPSPGLAESSAPWAL